MKEFKQLTMKNSNGYFFEYLLIAVTLVFSVLGFWNIYFGENAKPNLYHHLHVTTSFIWLLLLLFQLNLVTGKKFLTHKKIGLSVLFLAPILVATSALLTVHSASKGLTSGQGDFLIVQNVMVTLELVILIILGFLMKKNRILHGSFLLSTTFLFMGIALFFSLISFFPPLKIEGPETFYRFGIAATTGSLFCAFVGLFFFLKNRKSGWPLLLAGSFFLLNELIKTFLTKQNLIQPLTEFVGSLSQVLTFFGSFIIVLTVLVFTGILNSLKLLKIKT